MTKQKRIQKFSLLLRLLRTSPSLLSEVIRKWSWRIYSDRFWSRACVQRIFHFLDTSDKSCALIGRFASVTLPQFTLFAFPAIQARIPSGLEKQIIITSSFTLFQCHIPAKHAVPVQFVKHCEKHTYEWDFYLNTFQALCDMFFFLFKIINLTIPYSSCLHS